MNNTQNEKNKNNIWDITPEDLQTKIKKVEKIFKNKKVLVAFSGGQDSGLVLFLASIFSRMVKAITFQTPTTPSIEIERAKQYTEKLNVKIEILPVNSLSVVEIQQNNLDRCYHCKKMLLGKLEKIKDIDDFDIMVDGTNATDLGQIRPGLKALKESVAISPLADAGITKEDIHKLGKIYKIPTADYAPQACLATRVPFDTELKEVLLEAIDKSERFLIEELKDPSTPIRVRVHLLDKKGHFLVRLEGGIKLYEYLNEENNRSKVVDFLRKKGFTYITLDLEGFKSGSMHALGGNKQ